jgi:hypothetical protein
MVAVLKKYWILIAIVAFLFGRWVLSLFTGESVKKKVLTNVSVSESNLSDAQAANIADRLFDAMDDPTTYFNGEIVDILEPLSKPDFKKVYEAFGKRYYDTILKGEGGWLFNSQVDLLTWLTYEVKGDTLTEAKKRLAHLQIF